MKKHIPSSDQVISNIQQREALKMRLEQLQVERGKITTMKLRPAERKIIEVNQQINSYRASDNPDQYSRLLAGAEQDLQQLKKQQSEHEKDIHFIDDELSEIAHKLDNIDTTASVETVKHYMMQISNEVNKVEKIEGLMENQKGIINQLGDNSDEEIDQLQSRRSAILADITLGEAEDADLKAIDQEINALLEASSKSHIKDAPIMRNAQQVINGLMPKLEEAGKELKQLEDGLSKIMESFLISQGELIGKRYIKHAQGLIEEFKTLVAIEEVRISLSLNQEEAFGHLSSMNALRIPSLHLNCFNESEQHSPEQGILYSFVPMTPEKQAEINRSKMLFMDKLHELGLSDAFERLKR